MWKRPQTKIATSWYLAERKNLAVHWIYSALLKSNLQKNNPVFLASLLTRHTEWKCNKDFLSLSSLFINFLLLYLFSLCAFFRLIFFSSPPPISSHSLFLFIFHLVLISLSCSLFLRALKQSKLICLRKQCSQEETVQFGKHSDTDTKRESILKLVQKKWAVEALIRATDIDLVSMSSIQVYIPEGGKISPSLLVSHMHTLSLYTPCFCLRLHSLLAHCLGFFFVYNPRLDWGNKCSTSHCLYNDIDGCSSASMLSSQHRKVCRACPATKQNCCLTNLESLAISALMSITEETFPLETRRQCKLCTTCACNVNYTLGQWIGVSWCKLWLLFLVKLAVHLRFSSLVEDTLVFYF